MVVGSLVSPHLRARLQERSLPRRELVFLVAADGDRAVASVPCVVEVEVALEALERGQALLPRPLAKPARSPLVVVVRLPAKRDARVDRARSADDAPARKRERHRLHLRRPMSKTPVVRAHGVARAVDEIAREIGVGRVVGAGFEQQHVVQALLRHARGDDGARRSGPDDDGVCVHRPKEMIRSTSERQARCSGFDRRRTSQTRRRASRRAPPSPHASHENPRSTHEVSTHGR